MNEKRSSTVFVLCLSSLLGGCNRDNKPKGGLHGIEIHCSSKYTEILSNCIRYLIKRYERHSLHQYQISHNMDILNTDLRLDTKYEVVRTNCCGQNFNRHLRWIGSHGIAWTKLTGWCATTFPTDVRGVPTLSCLKTKTISILPKISKQNLRAYSFFYFVRAILCLMSKLKSKVQAWIFITFARNTETIDSTLCWRGKRLGLILYFSIYFLRWRNHTVLGRGRIRVQDTQVERP